VTGVGTAVLAACLAGLTAWLVSPTTAAPRAGQGRRRERAARDDDGRLDRPVRWCRNRLRPDPEPAVAELLAGLAAELAAGQPPALALAHAAADLHPPPCPRGGRAAAAGGDVVAALRVDAGAPGADALQGLAACWEVAEQSGAGLALAVGRLAEGVRATAEARAQLRAEVAAARASARLLAGLPVFGLVIGHWIGADPLAWLLGTWPGRAALALGLLLEVLGLVWLARMVRGVRAGL
jgi:tight adherence protein B